MKISPGRLIGLGLALLVGVLGALYLLPANDYIFLPDNPKAVAPLVQVEGEQPQRGPGGIYLVDVLVRRASLLERIFPSVRDGSTLVPESAIDPPGVSQTQRQQADLQAMARSQDIGAAVALRRLGHRVPAVPTGVLVNAVIADTPAVGKLRPGDVITNVNGQRVRGRADLRRAVRGTEPGDTITLTVRDSDGIRRETIRTAPDPERPSRPFIGVIIEQAATIKLPVGVRIDTGDIGGPSAGLAFALDVMEELGRDVDRGRKVAATGELELDGTVLPVGGLKQKTIGARDHGMDVLLVPAGENAAEARQFAGDLQVIPVRTFSQALRRLATLPQNG